MAGLTIAMTACWRPGYTRRTLAALAACRGIADCRLLVHVEPGDDEVRAIVEGWDACESEATWNAEPLGCNRNTIAAITGAVGSDPMGFMVYVDDDVLMAEDALEYLAWCRDAYRDDPAILTATAYGTRGREQDIPPRADWHRVEREAWFHGLGFGVWADRWRAILPAFARRSEPTWDVILNEEYRAPRGLMEARPVLSRCQNIGRESSRGPLDANYTRLFDRVIKLRHWAGDLDVPPGRFHETP